jgi:hypothetical protein
MTQMACLLAVATGFVGLWTLNIYNVHFIHFTVREGGGLICETKLPV